MLSAIRQIPKTFIPSRLFCSTATELHRRPIGYNRVALAGEIVGKRLDTAAGKAAFLLRTQDEDNQTCIHRIVCKFGQQVEAGQHVYIGGFLATNKFINPSNQNRYSATVNAMSLSIINPSHQNVNLVEMQALVFTNLIETQDFTMFQVLNTFASKLLETHVPNFIPIRVYDEETRKHIKETLQRHTMVRIVGQLNGDPDMNEEGLKRHSSYIKVTSILVQQKHDQIKAVGNRPSLDSPDLLSSDDEQEAPAESHPAKE